MAQRALPPVVNLVNAMLELRRLTGRELAIVGASWLDVALEINLREHFAPELRSPRKSDIFAGLLRSFAAKLDLVAALGSVHPDVLHPVDLVRQVRNEFAHTIADVDLSSHQMKTWLGQMDFTPSDALALVSAAQSVVVDHPPTGLFRFNGELFSDSEITGLVDREGQVLFFVLNGDARSADSRLRRQIYACMIGLLGYGLQPWLERNAEPGGLPIEPLPAASER